MYGPGVGGRGSNFMHNQISREAAIDGKDITRPTDYLEYFPQTQLHLISTAPIKGSAATSTYQALTAIPPKTTYWI